MTNDNQSPPRKDVSGVSRLLDRQVPSGYLQEWTERVAAQAKTAELETHTGFIFRVGTEWLALPTRVLDEVAERWAIHSLPHRRGGVLSGLTSVRGELLLCISLETLLGLEETEHHDEKAPATSRRMLVIARAGERVAFPVSEVHGIHQYHPRELRALPATVTKAGSYMTGLLPWRAKTVGCLEGERLFDALLGELS